MKLARKITIGLTVAIFIVMALDAFYLNRKQVVLFEGDLQGVATRGRATQLFVQEMWKKQGPKETRDAVERIADMLDDVDVRWISVDAAPEADDYAALSVEDRAALEKGEFRTSVTSDQDGDPLRISYIPMSPMRPGKPDVLEVIRPLKRELSFVRISQRSILVTTLGIIVACGMTALLLGYWFVGRPVELLRDRARRAGEGDFAGCLQLRQRDEMGELGAEIDDMCQRIAEGNARLATETEAKLAALERMRHAERLAGVGRFASGIAHELGTPLNVVSARAKMVASDGQLSEQVRGHARIIGEQAARMTEMIRQLLDLSRRRSTRMGAVSMSQAVKTVAEMLATVAGARQVAVDLDLASQALVVRLDPAEAQQVLSNVVLNAIQASHEGGRVRVTVDECRATPPPLHGGPEGQYVRILVADDGEGIAPEDLSHVFEPFFTTKGPGEGTGLGLAIAEGIVQDAGGWIALKSERGHGTEMSIYLPPAAGAHAAHAGSAS